MVAGRDGHRVAEAPVGAERFAVEPRDLLLLGAGIEVDRHARVVVFVDLLANGPEVIGLALGALDRRMEVADRSAHPLIDHAEAA